VAIAVIALVVAVLSYRQDRASQLAQTQPDLKVVVVETRSAPEWLYRS